jgi:uncharacterized protein YjbI with pentapeptide repeats
MPEMPANQNMDSHEAAERFAAERLATPQELAEFGGAPADAATEAKIIALLEEQMSRPEEEVPSVALAAALELFQEEIAEIAEVKAENPVAAEQALVTEAIGGELSSMPEPVAGLQEALELYETPGTDSTGDGELLEFAEVLDQHKLWVETAGKEGKRGDFTGADLCNADLTAANLQGAQLQKVNFRGADLSMANFRGANLVEADLREANLLGAEFAGANLMGANLYGAQGLWAGRLGGTNLFDATLPEAVSIHDGGKTIGQFTQSARRFYLLVLSLCVGACGLVALTTDVRLLLDASATVTARIPNFLPLQGFYLGAPLLLTVLYLRLQFLLLRLWGSMGALPAVFPDGQTPEKDGRWYLMGPIRPHLRWSRDPKSPLAMGESLLSMALAYWAVPAMLAIFWLRYLVMQDYRGTLLHVFLITLVGAVAFGMPRMVARVLRPGDWSNESTEQFMRDVLSTLRVPAMAGIALFVLSIGVIRGLPADYGVRPEVGKGDPRRWAASAFQSLGYRPYADITEESVSEATAKSASNEAGSSEATGPRLNEINLRYARGYRTAFANARMWRANLEGASLSEADFRGANLREAVLRAANLDHVQAGRANLVSADAKDAVFSGGDFRNADLSFANLAGATLATANLERATLYSVNLQRANLLRADLSHADLRDTKLEEAILSLAMMEQTDLSAAKMAGANLTGAQAKGTIFLESDLSRTDLRGAAFPGAVLRQAKMDGAKIEGADFQGALGLEAWQVCSAEGWRGAKLDADVRQAVVQSCGTPADAAPVPVAAVEPAPASATHKK